MDGLLTAKHVDDINMAGKEKYIDDYQKRVDAVFGSTKIHKHEHTNCGVRSIMDKDHNVTLDQDEYIKSLRPITSSELTGASADKEATKLVSDMFVSLRGAIAYALLTQAWIQVYVVSLQNSTTAYEFGCAQAECNHQEASVTTKEAQVPCNDMH